MRKLVYIAVFNKPLTNKSFLNELGELWSLRGSEAVIISSMEEWRAASYLALKAAGQGTLLHRLIGIDLEGLREKKIVENGLYNVNTPTPLIEEKWRGTRIIKAVYLTPIVCKDAKEAHNLISSPQNKLVKAEVKLIYYNMKWSNKLDSYRTFLWEAKYKATYVEAQRLKILGYLGIGRKTLEGYGKFKVETVVSV